MRNVFLGLLLLNLALFGWLRGMFGAHPVSGREPARLERQVAAERIRVLTDGEVEQLEKRAGETKAAALEEEMAATVKAVMDQVEKLCDAMCLVNHGKSVLQGGVSEVKSRYGKRNIQIDYEGDISFLRSSPLLDVFNDYGNQVEVRLKPNADSQDLLRESMQRVRVNRFELMEPSLEEIFIETVGKANA